MNVYCDCTPSPRWSMEFPSDFRSLKVIARGDQDHDALRTAITGFGHLADDGDHVYLDRDALVRLAGHVAGAPGWQDGFSSMLAYADAHGWSDSTGALRAHVEWVS